MADWTLGELVERVEYLSDEMATVRIRLHELEEGGDGVPERELESLRADAARWRYAVEHKLVGLYTQTDPVGEKADRKFVESMNRFIDELIEAEHE